ncbi:Thioredoxin-like fold [Trinorchestia longiramus]|nr:Thioredoxin-like fold [Trinorchestia longiramus]
MPPTVTASRGQSESSDDQSSDGECPSRLPEADSLDDDYCTTSCGSKYSDDSSKDQSKSSTPQHPASIVPAAGAEECLLSSRDLQEEDDTQPPACRFFKFKRKERIILYLFLQKLRLHLIMCLKFVLSLLLVLATVHFSFPESVRRPASHKFFPTHTLVTDFYEGELQLLAEKLQHTDLALVMYYAPWDRESQLARTQFSQAARILHNQVFFCAINCWQPQSFCRMNHKVTSYPALVLHINTGALKGAVVRESRAFPYSGPVLSEHLVRFVTTALRPYQHVPDRRHLASLQLTHSAVMLTYIHGGQDVEYTDPAEEAALHTQHQLAFWYRAALHWLDYDKRTEVAWAVVTNPSLATQLGLINSTAEHVARPTSGLPPVRLLIADVNYEFNRTLLNWREPKPLLEWVMAQLTETVGWLEVTGAKSSVLNSLLHRGPALLVFTPDCPQHPRNVFFDVVRGLWLQYSTCAPNNISVQDTRAGRMANFLLDSHRRHTASVSIASAHCAQLASNIFAGLTEAIVPDVAEDCSLPLSPDTSDVKTEMCEEEHFSCHPFMPFFAKPGSGVGELVWSLVGDACQSLFGFSSPVSERIPQPCHTHRRRLPANTTIATQCSHSAFYVKKSGRVEDDRVQELLLWHQEETCRRLQASEAVPLNPLVPTPSRALLDSLAGGACRSNRTLQFGVLDSRLHADLGSRWGLTWTHHDHASGAVLVDLSRQAHYVLQEPVSAASLAAFLVNFSEGLLDRVELSGVPVSRYSSDYTDDAKFVQQSVLTTLKQYAGAARSSDDEELQLTDKDIADFDSRQPNTGTDKTRFQSYASSEEELIEIQGKYSKEHSDLDNFLLKEKELKDVQEKAKPSQSHFSVNTDSTENIDDQEDVHSDEVFMKLPNAKHEGGTVTREPQTDGGGEEWKVSLIELSADTYYNFTHAPGQAVVVLHYSRSCVFCTAVSHALLTTASNFAQVAAQPQSGSWRGVSFARIDMSVNTLPWHLNFPRVPTLVYYPPYRKSNTVILDSSTPLTMGNMMRFISTQLNPRLRTRLAMAGCSSACITAISARLPALNSQVKSQLLLVSARLQRVTEALLKFQSEKPLVDDFAVTEERKSDRKSQGDPSTLGAPLTRRSSTQEGESKSANSLEAELRVPTLFDSSNTNTPLTRHEILQFRRSTLTEELTALRSQAQYLNLLQKVIVRRSTSKKDQADDSSMTFDIFLPFL